eukprot:TRINITY_DN5980_c0_g1_i1.p1 TRINITY_DN5980_c0_g1~~TRINITY_DN5980_c0_g1_i1.p1  ORF type:complete len:145 (-),score=49.42 TRINITY_DN5980_c0_g1_i1:655-1029(-)
MIQFNFNKVHPNFLNFIFAFFTLFFLFSIYQFFQYLKKKKEELENRNKAKQTENRNQSKQIETENGITTQMEVNFMFNSEEERIRSSPPLSGVRKKQTTATQTPQTSPPPFLSSKRFDRLVICW